MAKMNREQYPVVLKVEHVAEILDCSKRVAYEIMDRKDFPLVRPSKRLKRVNREAFFKWFDENSNLSKMQA
jgi:Helix-turn-helix domain